MVKNCGLRLWGAVVLGGLSGGGVCDSQSICLWFLVNGGDYFVCGVYGEGSQDAGYGFSGFCYDSVDSLGAALYRTMNWMMMKDWANFQKDGIYTILFAASMAAGMTLTTIAFRMVWRWMYRQRRM